MTEDFPNSYCLMLLRRSFSYFVADVSRANARLKNSWHFYPLPSGEDEDSFEANKIYLHRLTGVEKFVEWLVVVSKLEIHDSCFSLGYIYASPGLV